MNDNLIKDKEYLTFISNIKQQVQKAQIKAAVSVNKAMLQLYWSMGNKIFEKQKESKWGEGFLIQLSHDLNCEFPKMKGFSVRNLKYIRQWYTFWDKATPIGQQLVAQIPWGHNLLILGKIKNIIEAEFYVKQVIKNNWSRSVLAHQIEGELYLRKGKAVTNFEAVLPEPQSDLALQIIKDPYHFDFLNINEKHKEKELEDALLEQVTQFLLELGSGFSFIGRQVKISIDEEEFFIDLLFYHIHLHSYVVVELKTVKFKPEFTGKLNFYISAVDDILKTEQDKPSIGILICKQKNKIVVEYALRDIKKPMGVSEYTITRNLPDSLRSSLPSIESIETELDKK